MKYLILSLLCAGSLAAMEEVTLDPAPEIILEIGHPLPEDDSVNNHMMRTRAATLSSDLEEQIDTLIGIFEDVTQLEDEDYIRMIMEILVKNKQETFNHVSPYLSRRLRSSYNQIKELTDLRKRSSLKKLMKNLMAESIEDAFVKHKNQLEALDQAANQSIRNHRYVLAGTIVGGITTTLAAFLATYFSNCA